MHPLRLSIDHLHSVVWAEDGPHTCLLIASVSVTEDGVREEPRAAIPLATGELTLDAVQHVADALPGGLFVTGAVLGHASTPAIDAVARACADHPQLCHRFSVLYLPEGDASCTPIARTWLHEASTPVTRSIQGMKSPLEPLTHSLCILPLHLRFSLCVTDTDAGVQDVNTHDAACMLLQALHAVLTHTTPHGAGEHQHIEVGWRAEREADEYAAIAPPDVSIIHLPMQYAVALPHLQYSYPAADAKDVIAHVRCRFVLHTALPASCTPAARVLATLQAMKRQFRRVCHSIALQVAQQELHSGASVQMEAMTANTCAMVVTTRVDHADTRGSSRGARGRARGKGRIAVKAVASNDEGDGACPLPVAADVLSYFHESAHVATLVVTPAHSAVGAADPGTIACEAALRSVHATFVPAHGETGSTTSAHEPTVALKAVVEVAAPRGPVAGTAVGSTGTTWPMLLLLLSIAVALLAWLVNRLFGVWTNTKPV